MGFWKRIGWKQGWLIKNITLKWDLTIEQKVWLKQAWLLKDMANWRRGQWKSWSQKNVANERRDQKKGVVNKRRDKWKA